MPQSDYGAMAEVFSDPGLALILVRLICSPGEFAAQESVHYRRIWMGKQRRTEWALAVDAIGYSCRHAIREIEADEDDLDVIVQVNDNMIRRELANVGMDDTWAASIIRATRELLRCTSPELARAQLVRLELECETHAHFMRVEARIDLQREIDQRFHQFNLWWADVKSLTQVNRLISKLAESPTDWTIPVYCIREERISIYPYAMKVAPVGNTWFPHRPLRTSQYRWIVIPGALLTEQSLDVELVATPNTA